MGKRIIRYAPYHRLARKRGKKRVLIAVARTVLQSGYYIIRNVPLCRLRQQNRSVVSLRIGRGGI